MKAKLFIAGFLILIACSAKASGQDIPRDSKLFIEPNEGFETYLTAAIAKKRVPVTVVVDKAQADFVVKATTEHGKEPGFAQTWILGKAQRNEDASVVIVNAKTSTVVWSYAVRKYNARHGEQSTAESVAKHLKDVVQK